MAEEGSSLLSFSFILTEHKTWCWITNEFYRKQVLFLLLLLYSPWSGLNKTSREELVCLGCGSSYFPFWPVLPCWKAVIALGWSLGKTFESSCEKIVLLQCFNLFSFKNVGGQCQSFVCLRALPAQTECSPQGFGAGGEDTGSIVRLLSITWCSRCLQSMCNCWSGSTQRTWQKLMLWRWYA